MPESTDGRWTGLQRTPGDSRVAGDGLGVFPVHAVLLRTGKVLWFSGHAETVHYLTEAWVWDPTQPIATATRTTFPASTDIFCCHHATLDDGRVITVGGAMPAPDHGRGIRAICLFDPDPAAETWTKIGEMTQARWYPTLVILPKGDFAVFSGRTEVGASEPIASTVELFKPPFQGPTYTTITLAGGNKTFPTYPGLHLVPGGRIVHTGTTWRYENPVPNPIGTWSFRVTGPTTAAWADDSVSPAVDFREEGMSVLLPPAQDGRILLVGGAKVNASFGTFINHEPGSDLRAAEIVDTRTSPPTWRRIADMTHPRINLSAVLLPDGKVLVFGGHNRYKWDAASVPSNQADLYDPVADAWTPVASMTESRTYHSTGLLLPDGRVVVAGGVDPTQSEPGFTSALNCKTLEFYEPPYFFNGPRPTITNVLREDGPADTVAYGGQFLIETPEAPAIRKVGLMRPGAMTHHTDTEQRYVALEFAQVSATRLQVAVVNDPSAAPPGFYMLWIVDNMNRPCARARFVRLSGQRCFIITDRSTFSRDEVAPSAPPATSFTASCYVLMDGFLPSELGVTTATPTPAQLAAWAPTLTFHRPDGTSVPSMSATVEALLLEDPTLPAGVRQRFTFQYAVSIAGTAIFFQADGVTPIEVQTVTLRAISGAYRCTGSVTLTHQPNPYMLDGPTTWLSIDVRVFQLSDGGSRLGRTIGNTSADALAYIQGVLTDFNADPAAARPQFEMLSTDPEASRLELARSRGGRRVFNFAIAQVRYRGRTLSAASARVFFRLFTVAATGVEYRQATTYRRGTNTAGDPIPLLGLQGGEVVTMPCFASSRVNTALQSMTEQTDLPNVRTIAATGGTETTAYFGAWLDINQTELRFPLYAGGDGPYSSGMRSVQELLRGRHQCIVAELHFPSDLIPEGASPGSNDNLSQRNLIIDESANPGTPASRTVAHPFEVKPSVSPGSTVPATLAALTATEPETGRRVALDIPPGADELMIRWGNLPAGTEVSFFLSGVSAEELLTLAAQRIGPDVFEVADDSTIRIRLGQVSYIPLPAGRTTPLAGFMTMTLPPGITVKDRFKVVVAQVAGATRRVIGTFEWVISVRHASELLAEQARTLAVMRHIASTIPPANRWYPVFAKYLAHLADRVDALGGDPNLVPASPEGVDPKVVVRPQPGRLDLCCWLAYLVALLGASTIVAAGLLAPPARVPVVWGLSVLLVVAVIWWLFRCRPGLCVFLSAVATAGAVGAAVLGGLFWAGLAPGSAIRVLIAAAVMAGLALLLGATRGCPGLCGGHCMVRRETGTLFRS